MEKHCIRASTKAYLVTLFTTPFGVINLGRDSIDASLLSALFALLGGIGAISFIIGIYQSWKERRVPKPTGVQQLETKVWYRIFKVVVYALFAFWVFRMGVSDYYQEHGEWLFPLYIIGIFAMRGFLRVVWYLALGEKIKGGNKVF